MVTLVLSTQPQWEPLWEKVFSSLCGLTFVQIGANCAKCGPSPRGDPVYDYVHRYGWQGAVVEPNPKSFKLLKKNYENTSLTTINVAVSDSNNKTIPFFCPQKCKGHNELQMSEGCTTDVEVMKAVANSSRCYNWSTLRVPTVTLTDLWSLLGLKAIDLLVGC